ncbi:type VI secretion system baseplate subunit TssE [uncultured Desulfovibrio sp.]|uniref:type VI secretion system baseplate subunit TssE n=1 Tax=uncultured Desulfovibrio sp. TaxID=167968 RepID=UPI0025DBD07E|nr:type VI secretion system baseplate subunit TssE [uncultured Desulfovibrio sp.]
MAGSLFERLTLGQAGADMSEDESIRGNLSRVLGARQGAVQALPSYGLPDINDLTLSRCELQSMLSAAIERLVADYEPRLRNPRVVSLPMREDAPFTLFFSIQAEKIRHDGRLEPWTWTVSVDEGKCRSRT